MSFVVLVLVEELKYVNMMVTQRWHCLETEFVQDKHPWYKHRRLITQELFQQSIQVQSKKSTFVSQILTLLKEQLVFSLHIFRQGPDADNLLG